LSRIAVIGAGAWGTALAMVAGRRGDHEVRLWALEKEVLQSIARSRTNDLFLPAARCPLPSLPPTISRKLSPARKLSSA